MADGKWQRGRSAICSPPSALTDTQVTPCRRLHILIYFATILRQLHRRRAKHLDSPQVRAYTCFTLMKNILAVALVASVLSPSTLGAQDARNTILTSRT